MELLMQRCFLLAFVCPLLGTCSILTQPAEADWPTFRGPQRTGVAPDTGLLDRWPEGGPKVVWESTAVGRGYSSVAISAGKLCTLGDNVPGASDSDEYLICLNPTDGKLMWTSRTGPAWNEGPSDWQSSRSTPTSDGQRIYVLTAHGDLICFSDAGQELWRRSLKDDFAGKKGDGWGYSESVLIDGPRLICTPGGEQNTMVALDKLTGNTLWSCSSAEDRGAGHASVVIATVNGTRVYVQTTASGALGVRADDGKLLWTYAIPKTTSVIPTPIVREDLVFFTAGYKLGGALLRQRSVADGIEVVEIYPPKIDLQNKHGGVILVGDYLYGDSDAKGIPFCADLMTGEVLWSSRGSGRESASVVAADGCLYLHYADGTMTLAKASPAAFEELGSFKIPSNGDRPGWAHPVIDGGRLYVRDNGKLLCYALQD